MECRWCGERFRGWDAWAIHELEHQLEEDRVYWERVRALADELAA